MTDDDAARGTPGAPTDDTAAQLAAWRRDGAHRLDPMRFVFLEALARRAARLSGPARQLLDDKLSKAVVAYREKVAARASSPSKGEAPGDDVEIAATPVAPRRSHPATASAPPRPQTPRTTPPRARSPLADIVERLGRVEAPAGTSAAAAGTAAPQDVSPSLLSTAPPDLKTLSYFRSTWTRLSAEQRLSHALEQVPENAGPLNSQHLVHRALAAMRDTSPAYLQRFVAYVDALLWMDQVHSQAFVMPAREDKPEPARKGTRRRNA